LFSHQAPIAADQDDFGFAALFSVTLAPEPRYDLETESAG
jgi:hypothetical protein